MSHDGVGYESEDMAGTGVGLAVSEWREDFTM